MDPTIGKFEAKVRAEWVDDATTDAWRRWHEKSVSFWRELTAAMLDFARLEPGLKVLDLASGTGDPALIVAEKVGKTGQVTITDLAPQMIGIARENAALAGLTNVTFALADAHALAYPDESFDRVTCRLGVMYFWDCRRALEEIRRVLKPGGIAVLLAWGPKEDNEYMRTALAPFQKRKPMPQPPPGAPQPYRFGTPESLTAELRAAGFAKVREETRTVRQIWPGPPEELWQRLYEVSAPMRPYFDSFEAGPRGEAIEEAIAGFRSYFDGREISTRTTIVVAAAVK